MATFYANPNDERDPWIEKAALDNYGFRNWHLMFFCFSGLSAIVILICCCTKFRVPRTKQEIEGDYRRKQLASKFRERLKLIENQDMDALDLQEALKIIQEDFEQENRKIKENVVLQMETSEQPAECAVVTPAATRFSKKFAIIMLASKAPGAQQNQSNNSD